MSTQALLDVSSAFDTIDHTTLVHRLHIDFGFTYAFLPWYSTYLTDRTQYVSLKSHSSAFAPIHSGVPQGSFLEPILFLIYIKPLSSIIDSSCESWCESVNLGWFNGWLMRQVWQLRVATAG